MQRRPGGVCRASSRLARLPRPLARTHWHCASAVANCQFVPRAYQVEPARPVGLAEAPNERLLETLFLAKLAR